MVLFQYEVEDFSLSLFAVFLTFLTFSSHALIPSSKTGREARDVRYKTAWNPPGRAHACAHAHKHTPAVHTNASVLTRRCLMPVGPLIHDVFD